MHQGVAHSCWKRDQLGSSIARCNNSRSRGSRTVRIRCSARASLANFNREWTDPKLHTARDQQWSRMAAPVWHAAAAGLLQLQLVFAGHAVELVESTITNEGNVPSELSATGEVAAPKLSSLMSGSNKKQVEACTRKCVPTCIRGGEGAPGLGPISVRKEIVVFKDGFRSRQYCLSECAQVCSLTINKDKGSGSSSSTNSSRNSSSGSSSAAVQDKDPHTSATMLAKQ